MEFHYSLLIILVLFILLIFSIIKKNKKAIIINSFITVITLVVVIITTIRPQVKFNYYRIDNFEKDQSLILKDNVLYFENNKVVTYDSNTTTHFKPIYLKELTNYYVAVYSTEDNLLLENHFYQYDYENYDAIDTLVFISKENGVFIQPRTGEIIGNSIDLSAVLDNEHVIALPVKRLNTNDVNYYLTFNLIPHENKVYQTTNISALTLDKSITKFAFNEHIELSLYHDQTIRLVSYSFSYTVENGSFTGQGSSGEVKLLINEVFVKNGYFMTHNGSLYIIKNDKAIYKYNENKIDFDFIKHLNNLDTWESEIKAL